MTNFRAAQTNFSRGEIAPHLYGRFDVDAWNAAVRKARNVMVLKYGGLAKRPGTEFVAEVLDASQPNRLIPFQFSLTQTYALEMGQGYMSPCASGGRIVEEELAITNISNEIEARVTAAFHGYSIGNHVFLAGIAGGLGAMLNGRVWRVTSIPNDNSFTINADTRGRPGFAGASGGINRSAPPPPDPVPPAVNPPTQPPAPPVVARPGQA